MPGPASGALRSHRLLAVLGLLVAFNAVAIAFVLAGGLPAQPWIFAAWFVGDAIIGLIALGLTDRG